METNLNNYFNDEDGAGMFLMLDIQLHTGWRFVMFKCTHLHCSHEGHTIGKLISAPARHGMRVIN
jgi:hypothetical protein